MHEDNPKLSARETIPGTRPSLTSPVSQMCTQAQFEEAVYERWRLEMGLHFSYHRKHWEFAYILQALSELGMLEAGRHGLGFGVGREPLAAVMANKGVSVLATDMPLAQAKGTGWISTAQHARRLEDLNWNGLCPVERFRRHVTFREIDMRALPGNLGAFDFVWSACALEHLGSIENGIKFILESLKFLRPGGVAVHTTEYNLMSDTRTVDNDATVLFRRRDFTALADRVTEMGYAIALNFTEGSQFADKFVDVPPYRDCPHLAILLNGFVTTSFGLIISRPR